MAEALQANIAELKITDLVTKNLKAIDSELTKTQKGMKGLEDSSKSADRILSGMAGGLAAKFKSGLGSIGGAGQSTISGGVGGALSSIPVIGGTLSTLLGSVSAAKNQFISGVTLQTELKKLSNDFRTAFKEKGDSIISKVKREGFFSEQDIKGVFSGLAKAGVSPELLAKSQGTFQKFTQAQGLGSAQEGIQAIISGQIAAGKGLSKIQIAEIQALAPLLQNIQTADIGYQRIIEVMDSSSNEQEAFAKSTREAIGANKKVLNTNLQLNNNLADYAADVKNSSALQTTEFEKEKANIAITKGSGQVTAGAVQGGKQIVQNIVGAYFGEDKKDDRTPEQKKIDLDNRNQIRAKRGLPPVLEDKPPGRLNGGPVDKGKSYVIHEQKKEIFVPGQPGTILPKVPEQKQPQKQEKQASVINYYNNNINVAVTVPFSSMGVSIEREIRTALDNLARTTFRQNTGLPLKG